MAITGGRSLVSSSPDFSLDGQKLLVCTGNTVSIFSTSTGLKMMELEGHTALVTSVVVTRVSSSATKVPCFCWTSSLDGTIRYWDFSVPEVIKTVDVRVPIFAMVIPDVFGSVASGGSGKPPDRFAFISAKGDCKANKNGKPLHGQIWRCNLVKGSLSGAILAETRYPVSLAVSTSGEFVGIHKKRKACIWKILAKDSTCDVKKITLHHTKSLSVLAFHPTERIVAAGDVVGRILIWRDFGNRTFGGSGVTKGREARNDEERPEVRGDDDADSCSTWHWHPTEVKVLRFSSDGAYLYSGAREGVLVVWQLETGNKKFLPRIGSPLLYFNFADSPDTSLSSISCADNQIHLLTMPAMRISKSISGIKPRCSYPETYKGLTSRVAFDHSAGLVATCTENYCVQLYSLSDDREVSQVQVCERNYQPNDDTTLFVAILAVSMDGSKLSTVEVQLPEEELGGLVCLKFWDQTRSGEFSLSTPIYEPHGDAGVSAIAFHPTRDMAVTSSFGGNFKIWVRRHNMKQTNTVPSISGWSCHSVGSYKKTPMTAASFSADGSVLAVASENVISLWDPDRNVLVALIGETLAPINKLCFIGKSDYLVSLSRGSRPQLCVWSMAKLSISWSYKLHAEAVTAFDGSCFAVLALVAQSPGQIVTDATMTQSMDGVILIFDAENPVPLAIWSVQKAKGGEISFIFSNLNSHHEKVSDDELPTLMLAYVSGDQEYVVFDPYCKDQSTKRNKTSSAILPETGNFGYMSIYGELPQLGSKMEKISSPAFAPSDKPWETIFSGSTHALPPLKKLCAAFLESF
ncbi:hypothetical protein Scep_017750 [Stephania cephalantha]|uniref:WD repeat-containing protein 75 second beta-propeller domain-containing protein n=1 Tax=Stephania cephalantha TaxID=152367 RepID=A0AAP0IS01_9MAGN